MTQEQLKKKYKNRAVVTKLTKNYSMVTYPSSYYLELLDILIKNAQ